jgi:hypothetical protein
MINCLFILSEEKHRPVNKNLSSNFQVLNPNKLVINKQMTILNPQNSRPTLDSVTEEKLQHINAKIKVTLDYVLNALIS